jgi:hypothetical protein
MPAPRGQRPATRIRVIARRIRDYAATAQAFDKKWIYERASEIEDLATEMNAASGVPDPSKRRRPAKRKSAVKKRPEQQRR